MAALRRFAEADGVVLLGTQMVAKGHHFAGVELAAVIDADTSLGAARLSRRGAHVPADHPARRPQRPRRAGARARADVPAGRAPDRLRRAPRRRRASSPRRSSAAATSATRRSATSCGSSSRAPTLAPVAARARGAGAGLPERGAARPGAAPAPARPPPRAARREDGASARGRDAGRARCSPRPRPRCAAPADGGRRRRSAVALSVRQTGVVRAHAGRRDPRRVGRPRRHARRRRRERERLEVDRDVTRSWASRSAGGCATSSPSPTTTSPRSAGRCPYMQRLRQIEHETERHLERLAEAYARGARTTRAAWRRIAERWNFSEVNELIERHNRWYPLEARLADGSALARLRQGRRTARTGASRSTLTWILERFPA